MKPAESLIVLKLPSGKYVPVYPMPNALCGFRATEIHTFGLISKEQENELLKLAAACGIPVHFN